MEINTVRAKCKKEEKRKKRYLRFSVPVQVYCGMFFLIFLRNHNLIWCQISTRLLEPRAEEDLQLPKNKGHALLSATVFSSQVFARKTGKHNKVFLLWKTWYQQSCAFVNIAYPAPGEILLVNKHYQQKHNFARAAALTERLSVRGCLWTDRVISPPAEKVRAHSSHGLHAGFIRTRSIWSCIEIPNAQSYQRRWQLCVMVFVSSAIRSLL